MMVAYTIVALFMMSLSLVLCQSNADQTCTGSNVYIDKKTGNCTVCPTTCPLGYGYFEHPCGYGEMRRDRCYPCVDGENYSIADDRNRCYPCNLCHNHEIITNCTVTADTQCGACVDGYGWDQLRTICKDCKHARRDRLPGCEKPPEVMVTEQRVHRVVVCENVAGQSPPDQYSWFLNDKILDTSDENFFVKGNLLLILEPGIEDYGNYKCRAEWNANKEHNFDVKKSSNNVEFSNEEQHGESTSDYTTQRSDFLTTKQHKEINVENGTVAIITGRFRCIHKEWKFWLVLICLCVLCLCIPTGWLVLRWIYNRRVNYSRSTTENTLVVYSAQSSPPHSIPSTAVPLLSPESQNSCRDDVLTESEVQHSHVEELNTSIQMEDISNDDAMVVQDTEEMITRQPDESVESLYKKALECSSGLYYYNLDLATTDRLAVLLNPHTDPKPPIKYWKHLADKLGTTDQATLNSLGTYKRFHDLLQTQDVSMQTFLEALWTVENDQATKVVCRAVIKMHGNRN